MQAELCRPNNNKQKSCRLVSCALRQGVLTGSEEHKNATLGSTEVGELIDSAEQLLASPEKLCSMELVSSLV
jgi:hypothetical protein